MFQTHLKKISFTFLAINLTVLSILVGSLFLPKIDVSAQNLGIKPYAEAGEKQKGVFRFIASAGEEISDFLVAGNSGTEEGELIIEPKDSSYNNSGQLTATSETETNKSVGNWISVEKNRVKLKPQTAEKIGFKIKIPNNTPSGDYAGMLTSYPAVSPSQDSGNVVVNVRTAVAVYITVRGNLKIDNQIDNLKIINPSMDNFTEELNRRTFINPDNMVVFLNIFNRGNIFSTVSGKLKITNPRGETKETNIQRTVNINSNNPNVYIETKIPYIIGKTEVKFDYTSSPYNLTNGEKIESSDRSNGSISYTSDLTEEQLEKFKTTRQELNTRNEESFGKNNPNQNDSSNNSNNSTANKTTAITASNSSSSQKNSLSQSEITLIGLGSIIVLLLLLIIAYLVYREYKKAKNSQKDSEDKVKKEDIQKIKPSKKDEKVKNKS